MTDIGYSALVIALIASAYSAIAFIASAKNKPSRLIESARNSVLAVCGLVTISVLVLLIAIFSHNFELEYVASYTNRQASPIYLLTALWAGNSGSLLFWAWLLSLCATVVVLKKQGRNEELVPHASAIIMVTQAFFLLVIVSIASPFGKLSVVPTDGTGLNPMLENPGMVLHPPALLAGYVIFTIPFAFAIAALLNRGNNEWLLAVRKWALLAWLLLGVGNIIGAWWAYVELGWGGYWAWDPVENAGLMPWLTATAFLHSSIMQRRKGTFKVWSMILIIATFCLVLFGTFITRSGILHSVHTFNDSRMGPFFITFIVISLFGSLALLYRRYGGLRGKAEAGPLLSRESTFTLNNVLLVGATMVVFMGTIFPALTEWTRGVKVNVNASFFNKVNGPLFMIIILLVGVCTVYGWKQATHRNLLRNLGVPLGVAYVLFIVLLVTVTRELLALLAFSACGFVLSAILSDWFKGARARHQTGGKNYFIAWLSLLWLNKQRYGGYTVHIGIIIMAIGVIGSSFYGVEKEAALKVGESLTIKRYIVTYNGLDSRETPDRTIVSARLAVYSSGELIDNLVSERYFHKSQQQPVTEVAIRYTPVEDLYVILEGWSDSGATADFKVLVNPLVSWLWIGGGVFLLGGLVAFWPERRKQPITETEE